MYDQYFQSIRPLNRCLQRVLFHEDFWSGIRLPKREKEPELKEFVVAGESREIKDGLRPDTHSDQPKIKK